MTVSVTSSIPGQTYREAEFRAEVQYRRPVDAAALVDRTSLRLSVALSVVASGLGIADLLLMTLH
jgi:hypothetical protein